MTRPGALTAEETPICLCGAPAGDPADPDDVVDVAVWAPDGTLTELNVSWYGERPPAALPDAGELIVGPGPEPIRVD
jgi:hypothetical protein